MDLTASLDAEQRRAAAEGLSEEELALFDLLQRDDITKADRERLKHASRQLLTSLTGLLASMKQWTEKKQTRAEVQVLILDQLLQTLPNPPYSSETTQSLAGRVFEHVWRIGAGEHVADQPFAA